MCPSLLHRVLQCLYPKKDFQALGCLVGRYIWGWGGSQITSSLPTCLPLLSPMLSSSTGILGWKRRHQRYSAPFKLRLISLAATKLWVPGLLATADLRSLVERNWGHLDPGAQLGSHPLHTKTSNLYLWPLYSLP